MSVNWHEQWAQFAQNFYDGKAHIPIGEKTLLLKPGPGFGDLSHPTTRLMIEMMKENVPGKSVVDIGSGSGILTLAAYLMGARSAIGVEIDRDAIEHAEENAKLNGIKARFQTAPPPKSPAIMLMNMILSEQRNVHPERLKPKLWIISGILSSQTEQYLAQAKSWKWSLLSFTQESEWCGFIFTTQ